MSNWFLDQYIRLRVNHEILWDFVVDCFAVNSLRTFSVILLGVFMIKMINHFVRGRSLKKQFPRYTKESDSRFYHILEQAASDVGLKKVPPVFKFSNRKPLIFTMGLFRPTVFLAPALKSRLTDREIDAALKHELVHVKRRDTILDWVLGIIHVAIPIVIIQLFAVHFVFNAFYSKIAIISALMITILFPILICKLIFYLRELSCDDMAIQSGANPIDLASSLIKTLRLFNEVPVTKWSNKWLVTRKLLPSVFFFKHRVKRLLNYKIPWHKIIFTKSIKIVGSVLLIGIIVFWWKFAGTYDGILLESEYNQHLYCLVEKALSD